MPGRSIVTSHLGCAVDDKSRAAALASRCAARNAVSERAGLQPARGHRPDRRRRARRRPHPAHVARRAGAPQLLGALFPR
eukprot:768715-Prymnesium_polylepis.1